jgi:hypothetical protein
MIALRSSSVIAAQSAISCNVRPQPWQVPVAVSSTQILMQGLSKRRSELFSSRANVGIADFAIKPAIALRIKI